MTTLNWFRGLSPELARSQLFCRLEGVLEFARTQIERLDRDAEIWNEQLDPYIDFADKVIVETALLALVASRVVNPPDKINSLIRHLACQLTPMIRTERNRALLMRYPHTAAALGIGHFILVRLGKEDEEFEYLVQRAFESGYVEAVERLPYRTMDVLWLRGLAEPSSRPEFDDILPFSILTRNPHPIHLSAADTYALTHAIMYATDFGSKPMPINSVNTEYIADVVDAAIAYHILTENIDILGELLISTAILDRPLSPYVRFGWHLLIGVWDRLGFLPSPTFDRSAYTALSGTDASSYVFRHLYHTTYVGGMLCALMLGHVVPNDCAEPWMASNWNRQKLLDQCLRTISLAENFCSSNQRNAIHLKPPYEQALSGRSSDRVKEFVDNDVAERIIHPINLSSVEKSHIEVTITCVQEYCDKFGNSRAPWIQALSNSPLDEAELVLVLSDAILIHAIQDYKLPVLAEMLSFIASLDVPLTTTFREAVAFLIRQQLPCGAIGCHFVHPANLEKPEAIEVTASLARCLALVVRRLSNKTPVNS